LETDLTAASRALVNDALLAEKYHDHLLYGEWSGFRDCHVEPDLVIHEKPDTETGTAWIAQRTRMVSV
jgi:mRNA-degrading endonuclease YafQ of YafQ-DinJ toxin-antitoxin module